MSTTTLLLKEVANYRHIQKIIWDGSKMKLIDMADTPKITRYNFGHTVHL